MNKFLIPPVLKLIEELLVFLHKEWITMACIAIWDIQQSRLQFCQNNLEHPSYFQAFLQKKVAAILAAILNAWISPPLPKKNQFTEGDAA